MTRDEIEELLVQVEEGLRASRPGEVVGLAEQALQQAERLADRGLRFEAARKAGWARRLLGDSSQALAHFSTALAAADEQVNPRLLFDTRIAWVVVARRVPGVPTARLLSVLDKAWLDASSDPHHQMLVLEERAAVLIELGRSTQAWDTVEHARQVVQALTGSQRFFALLHLAWAARKLARPTHAHEWLEEARALPRSDWGVRGEAALLNHLGHTQLALGQPETAYTTAKELWALAPSMGRQLELAAAGLLFEASRETGRWDDAALAAARQLALVRENGGVSKPLLWALLDQVQIHLHGGEVAEAWKALEEAEPIAVRLDHDTGTSEQRDKIRVWRMKLGEG
jgi:tetratricopeptide (TPR) repeat protein